MSKISNRAQGFKNLAVFASSAIILVISSFVIVSPAVAQGNPSNRAGSSHESERAAEVRALNNSVLQLHGQAQENASSATGIRGLAAMVLTQRAAALQTLIQEDPHSALTFAFSPELLADLAAKFPDSSAALEAHTTLSGPIELWIFDSGDLKTSHSQYQMKVGLQTVNLHFAGKEPSLAKGSTFQVTGVVLGKDMAVSDAQPASTGAALSSAFGTGITIARAASSGFQQHFGTICFSLLCLLGIAMFGLAVKIRATGQWAKQFAICMTTAAIVLFNPSLSSAQTAICSTTGVQNVAVLLVTFPNATLPSGVTTQSLGDIFFNTNTGVSVDGYLRAASYGQTSATGNVFGPYTLNGSYTSCGDVSGAVLNDAVAAAVNGGVNLQDYSRVFLVFPDAFGCGWAGFASVGNCSISSTSGNFNASVGYLVASYMATRSSGVSVASHELGHNFGLLHSGLITPTTVSDVLGPTAAPGTEADLGDYWSTMGELVMGLYPAPQKAEILKWMASSSNYQVVQNSGTYTLQPLEASPAGLQALKIQRGAGSNEWLWVEYRQPIGNYDPTLLSQPFSGALIHYEDPNTPLGHTYLANFTPSDASGNSPALAAGQSWTDPYSNLSISAVSANSNGLTVSVTYGATPCVSSAPSVSFSPLDPSAYPGQSASYAVSVTNQDSSGCSASAINLNSSEPSGWLTALSTSSVTLNPGQSASITMGKGVPQGTPPGTYAVNLSATNNSATAAGTANATVMTPPSLAVSLSVPAASFSPPGTVAITAAVTSGGVPAATGSVTFTLTTPSGGRTTQSAPIGSGGVATWNYKLSQRSAVGNYSVTAQATLSSGSKKAATTQSAASSAITFNVL